MIVTSKDKSESLPVNVERDGGDISSDQRILKEACQVLIDSGANLSVAPPVIAVYYKCALYKWKKPVRITFGNDSFTSSKYYIDLGKVFGKMAIVNSIRHIILSVPQLLSQGYQVLFGPRKKCSIWCDNVKVIDLGMDEEKGLFYLDLNEYLKVDQCPVVQRA
jgi:hypothetical protein